MDRPSEPGHDGLSAVSGDVNAQTRSAELALDEAAADEARRGLREMGIVPIEPDDRIGVMLAPEEHLVTVRRDVSLERRKVHRDPGGRLSGDLYVTTRRLVYLGRVPVEYPLVDIQEALVGAGALRLVVGESRGVEIGVDDPRVLRVEIAAVRETARALAFDAGEEEEARNGGAPPDQEAGR